MTHSSPTIYHVGAARDAHGVDLRPASVVIHRSRIVQISRPEQVSLHDFDQPRVVHLPRVLVLPRMVNAHAHLDMATAGPRRYQGPFTQWLMEVITHCPSATQAAASVAQGWRDSVAAGVGLIGDIARFKESAIALAATGAGLHAVSFLECFGQGARQPQAIDLLPSIIDELVALHEQTGLAIGLEPHAPYSVGLDLYLAAAAASHRAPLRLSTHLAETLEEDQFIRAADGPFKALLQSIGKWDDSITACHHSPAQRLAPALSQAHWLVAHCNYVDDDDIALLADTQTAVAYCPVASHYFGHRQHRYRDMLAAGVNVCLGTDSVLCQPADEAQPLGMLPQMRHLFRHDGVSSGLLLEMATTRGARALGTDEALVTLQADSPGDLVAVHFDPQAPADAFTQALRSQEAVQSLAELGATQPHVPA